jgi:hypothetical protein
MLIIQEKIGDGLKTGALTPDQSQMFLTTLKGIRTDYTELRDKRVYRDEWEILLRRLDVLGDEINRSLGRTTRIEDQGMATGLSHSKGGLMTEESTDVCLRQRGENFNPDWTPFDVNIFG